MTVDQVVGGPRSCTGLSSLGVRQAEALRARLHGSGRLRSADVLLSSTMRRAVQTAEVIQPAVGDGSLDIEQRDDLCEIFPGEGDGLSWADFSARYGSPRWDLDPTTPMSPGGESLVSFRARVGRGLDAVVADFAGKHIVIACHGGVVVNSFVHLGLVEAGIDAHPIITVTNTSMTTWRRPAEGGRWRLLAANDAAHLDGLLP